MALKRDQSAWNDILGSINKLYNVSAANAESGLKIDPPAFLQELDHELALPAMEAESLPFSALHVEPLLNEASDLLDRAIADRAEWNALRVRAASQWLEIVEFLRIDAIHKREQEAGIYDVAHARAQASLEAERLSTEPLETLHELAVEQVTRDYSDDAKDDEVALRTSLAYVNAAPPTTSKESKWYGDTAPFPFKGREFPWLNRRAASGHWKMQSAANHELEVAARSVEQASRAAEAQSARSSMDKLRSQAMMSALEAEERWESANREFREERSQTARDVMDLRIREACRSGGSLNFVERMRPIRDRFSADFREADARLRAVAKGIQLLYGDFEPLPPASIDEYVGWARKAINRLVRFSRREQNIVVPLSVAVLSDSAWERGREGGEWTLDVPETLLPGAYHVRLRGVTVFVETTKANDYSVWRVDVTAPTNAVAVHHPLLTNGAPRRVVIEQSAVPVVTSARAASRMAERAADVCGVAALHNVSPFGRWRVQVQPRAANSPLTREHIADVQLDLHLAVVH